MPPATKKKRPTDSMDLESDEEPYERKARKQMAQSKLAFGKQVETSAAAPAAAADDSDDDDDEDDLDMSFLGGSSSAKAEEKPAKSRFSDVHSDKPKSKPEPKSMSKTKVRRSLATHPAASRGATALLMCALAFPFARRLPRQPQLRPRPRRPRRGGAASTRRRRACRRHSQKTRERRRMAG